MISYWIFNGRTTISFFFKSSTFILSTPLMWNLWHISLRNRNRYSQLMTMSQMVLNNSCFCSFLLMIYDFICLLFNNPLPGLLSPGNSRRCRDSGTTYALLPAMCGGLSNPHRWIPMLRYS